MKISFIQFCKLFAVAVILSCTSCEDNIADGYTSGISLRISLNPTLQLRTRSGKPENEIKAIHYMVFDEGGALESRQIYDVAPQEAIFNNLVSGNKTLLVIANVDCGGYSVEPIRLANVASLAELHSLKLMNPDMMTGQSEALPMIHVRELEFPLPESPIVVDLTRQVARLTLVNDIVPDKWAKVDSISFQGLTKEASLFEEDDVALKRGKPDGVFGSDTIPSTLFLLPVEGKQVGYTLYGKTHSGVTQQIKGQIAPRLAKNNSYRLKLSTGEVTETGIPGDLAVSVDPAVGIYSAVDTTLTLFADAGTFTVSSSSYDVVDISYSDAWLANAPMSRVSKNSFDFTVSASPFVTADTLRKSVITLSNSMDPTRKLDIKVQQQGENRGPKYYVILVGGQSNASGRDMSAFNAQYDHPDPRVFEFGQEGLEMPYPQKFTSASTLSIVSLMCRAQNLDSHLASGKSMHLSLGKQILPYIPADYNILVVSCAFPASGFTVESSVGIYDPIEMRNMGFPSNLPSQYKLAAKQGVMYNMMVDRVKYALSLNKRNRFLGVVWSQGEVDTYINPNLAYQRFDEYAQAFFDTLNEDVPREQISGGFAGRHLWYSIDATPTRKNWYTATSLNHYPTSHVFGRYKVWNPDTYIALPPDIKQNDEVHFGQNSFPEVIVPRIVNRMVSNGIFEDRAPAPGNAFVREITAQEALLRTGHINDEDIQEGLFVCLPFSDANSVTANLSQNSLPVSIQNQGMSLSKAFGLVDIHGNVRSRMALSLHEANGTYMSIQRSNVSTAHSWSASFMLRRTNSKENFLNRYLLRVPGKNIGIFYHKYGLESEGGYLGIAFQPSNPAFDRLSSVVARINDADFVRSHEDWIHYSMSYNHITRMCKLYMNGQLTMSKTLNAGRAEPILSSLQLNHPSAGIDGQLIDLYLWDREVPAETLFKTYIMSYYGLTK